MRNYELTFILPGNTTEVKQKRILEKVEKLVSAVSGEVLDSTSWGKKDLFYPIKKQTSGVYYFLNLELPSEGAPVVNREIEIDDEVLRHLLVLGDQKSEVDALGQRSIKLETKEEKQEKPKKAVKAKTIKKNGK